MPAATIIIRSKEGNIVSKTTNPAEIKDAIRKIVAETVSNWSPEKSDFIVIKDNTPIQIKLPISNAQYEMYSKFEMQRGTGGSVIINLPIYIISFDNEWQEEAYVDKEVLVVAPALDETVEAKVAELAVEATKPGEPGEGHEDGCECEECECEECEDEEEEAEKGDGEKPAGAPAAKPKGRK